MLRKFIFDIPTISCTSCTGDIRLQLERIVGVRNVIVSPTYQDADKKVMQGGTATMDVYFDEIKADNVILFLHSSTAKHHTAILTKKEKIAPPEQTPIKAAAPCP